jgi:iron(III) transport system substrate-binding protein
MNSTELYNRFISEQASGGVSGDVVWSSMGHRPEARHRLRHGVQISGAKPAAEMGGLKAYGTTYEPVVFIYNKRLIPAGDVPDSHAALAKLIASQTDKFKNKVTTYDIEKSGLGFMLSVQDHNADPNYFKTLADVAKGA